MIELQADGTVLVRAFLAVTLGILALFTGKALNARIGPLREYNIPEPVTGGLLFAAAFLLFTATTGHGVVFEMKARDVLLVYFFTSIGLNARIADLKAAGRPLVVLLACVTVLLIVQNVVGIAVAGALGQPPAIGLLAGSVAMLGGHGTAIAWAPTFATEHGITYALEIGALAATGGLVMASLAGGPTARFLVERHHLTGPSHVAPDVGVHYGDTQPRIDYFSFLNAVLAIHLSAIIGIVVYQGLARAGINLPLFLPCLFAGILLSSVVPKAAPRLAWPSGTPSLALIAEISLAVFLGMSLMSMQLWALSSIAGPLLLLLAVQLTLAVSLAIFVVFPALGRSYDAAVVCAGFIGFGLGATPTAMANMTAVTQRHGASHVAFLVVPLVGAFFLDVLNAVAIRIFLSVL